MMLVMLVAFGGDYALFAASRGGVVVTRLLRDTDDARPVVRMSGIDCSPSFERYRKETPLSRLTGQTSTRERPGFPESEAQSSSSRQNGCGSSLSTQANPRHAVVIIGRQDPADR